MVRGVGQAAAGHERTCNLKINRENTNRCNDGSGQKVPMGSLKNLHWNGEALYFL